MEFCQSEKVGTLLSSINFLEYTNITFVGRSFCGKHVCGK